MGASTRGTASACQCPTSYEVLSIFPVCLVRRIEAAVVSSASPPRRMRSASLFLPLLTSLCTYSRTALSLSASDELAATSRLSRQNLSQLFRRTVTRSSTLATHSPAFFCRRTTCLSIESCIVITSSARSRTSRLRGSFTSTRSTLWSPPTRMRSRGNRLRCSNRSSICSAHSSVRRLFRSREVSLEARLS